MPKETVENRLLQLNPKYLLTAQETAPTTNNLHIHCVIIFPTLFSTNKCKKFDIYDDNGQIYHADVQAIQSLKGSIEYVKKDGNWREYGECPIKTIQLDKKQKMQFIRDHSIDELFESGLFGITEMKNAIYLKRELETRHLRWPTFKKRQITWYYGKTGCGKTRSAVEEANRNYEPHEWIIISGDLKTFMTGYNGQKCVIFDDIRAGSFRFEQLLRLTDGYPLIVNIKGGQTEWLAERIIFTAPIPPQEMYVNKETGEAWDHIDQLIRRIEQQNIISLDYETNSISPILPAPEQLNNEDTSILEERLSDCRVPHLPGENSEVERMHQWELMQTEKGGPLEPETGSRKQPDRSDVIFEWEGAP